MKILSALVSRLEPGNLWVHLSRPGSGGMTVASMIAHLAIENRRDLVVCSYDGLIESLLPDNIRHRDVATQAALEKPSKYPAFLELASVVVPSIRFSNRTFIIVDGSRLNEAFVDLDDWKALAKDIRHPMMITWTIDPDDDPEDYDQGGADYVTWSFYDSETEELVIQRAHEPK